MKKRGSRVLRKRKKERGIILAVSIMVTACVLILVTPFLFKLSATYRITEKSYDGITALNLAEAGIERAIWELNYGDILSWAGDSSLRTTTIPSFESPDGTVRGEIIISVQDPEEDNPIVEATGKVPFIGNMTIERKVRVNLGRDYDSLFGYGIFAENGLELHGNGNTDSYNSTLGAYGGLNIGNHGDVGTNAVGLWLVQLMNNTEINGNTVTGFGSDPSSVISLQNNSRILGEIGALEAPIVYPSYLPQTDLAQLGAFYVAANSPEVMITESAEYSSFTMESNTKVTINGSVTLYVNGNFTMMSNSQLDISNDSEVEIILGNGVFTQSSKSSINNLSQDPKSLSIFCTPDFNLMVWRSNSQFFGTIYAPEAYVDYSANHDFFGSVVSDYFNLSSQASIHYDESLREWDKYQKECDTYIVRSWKEIH